MGNEQAIVESDYPPRHLLTVDDFLALDEAGAFEGLGDVELVDGEIYVLSPVFQPHAWVVATLTTDLTIALREIDSELAALSPVSSHLDEHSLPQPDIVIVSSRGERFVEPSRIRLVVEVSSSTLRYDLGKKARLYARTGVPEYWVADVKGRRLIRLHGPSGEDYVHRDEFAFGATIRAATIDGLSVDTARLA